MDEFDNEFDDEFYDGGREAYDLSDDEYTEIEKPKPAAYYDEIEAAGDAADREMLDDDLDEYQGVEGIGDQGVDGTEEPTNDIQFGFSYKQMEQTGFGREEGASNLQGAMGRLEAGMRTPIEQFRDRILVLMHEETYLERFIRQDNIDRMMYILKKIPNVVFFNAKVSIIASSLYIDIGRNEQKITNEMLSNIELYTNPIDVIRYYRAIKKYN